MQTNPRTPVLLARELRMQYGSGGAATLALAGVNIDVLPGSLAIMGPSGSGKTTLLHVLAGVLKPTAGSVQFRGQNLAASSDRARTRLRRSDFGFVFQSGQLLPELPAVENVALPLMLTGMNASQAREYVYPWLERLGLAGLEERRPGELSGGQAQRVAIARALIAGSAIVLAVLLVIVAAQVSQPLVDRVANLDPKT